MTRRARWSDSATAAAVTVAAVGWLALLGAVVVHWPGSWLAWAVLVAAAALVAVIAVGVGRRAVHDRETREQVRDGVLVVALTTAAGATVYALVVLVLAGRPSAEATDTARAAAAGAFAAAVAAVLASRRLARWSQRALSDAGRPRRELLEQFSRRLAGTIPIEDTLEQLAESLRPACAAAAAEVWRWDGSSLRLAAASPGRVGAPIDVDADRAALLGRAGVSGPGWVDEWLPALHDDGGPVRVAPLAVQGALVGVLVVHRAEASDDFDDGDDEALARVARLVAAVLHNAELDGELRRTVDDLRRSNVELRSSRARLVTVADAERRRLERDLHDGAQAELAAVAVKVQLAKALLAADPDAVGGVLEEIGRELNEASAALRSLAHGIFPPLLLTGGLADALAGVAAHAPVDVRVGRITPDRFDREAEAAVYFCCTEAVHNATKHGGRGVHVTIDVTAGGGRLAFSVADDGTGFDPAIASDGHGFTNMVDRIGALDGTLEITSSLGRGTTVCGSLPAVPLSETAR